MLSDRELPVEMAVDGVIGAIHDRSRTAFSRMALLMILPVLSLIVAASPAAATNIATYQKLVSRDVSFSSTDFIRMRTWMNIDYGNNVLRGYAESTQYRNGSIACGPDYPSNDHRLAAAVIQDGVGVLFAPYTAFNCATTSTTLLQSCGGGHRFQSRNETEMFYNNGSTYKTDSNVAETACRH